MQKQVLLGMVFFLIVISAALLGDNSEVRFGERPFIDIYQVPDEAIEEGRILIKFRSDYSAHLDSIELTKDNRGVVLFDIPSLDELNRRVHVYSADKLFQSAALSSEYEWRHRLWGFHLWYELHFQSRENIRDIVTAYRELDVIIEWSEPEYKKRLISKNDNPIRWTPNDPQLTNQWHYNNTGQQNGTPGADISLFDAWDIEKGHSDVIVAIIDSGVQFNHPDLAANMWEDIGFNFVNNISTIYPGNHGTHVAGTVAAVSNNNVGVAGVAGGSGTGDGVRLMSCQVFTDSSQGGFHLAPVYAADNDAAISQNSWSYTTEGSYNQNVLDAIDYFNANGGGDVLDGGITIFAAGNRGTSGNFYPGIYPGTFSVAATNNKDEKAFYSTYDEWVDISAPGGETWMDDSDPRGILSTTTGDNYAYYEGTSMACPHASGVAALLISYAYRNGVVLGNNDIANILRDTTDDHYSVNPGFIGLLGTGRLNAHAALLALQDLLPDTILYQPRNLIATAGVGFVNLEWQEPEGRLQLLGYNVYRDGDMVNMEPVLNTYYEDTDVITGVSYAYRVTAVYDEGESIPSNEVSATPVFLNPPINFTAEVVGPNNVQLNWDSHIEPEELIYDNGVYTGAYRWPGYTLATRMSPAESCQILTLRYLTTGYNTFNAEIYNWAGSQPGANLLFSQSVPVQGGVWVDVDVSSENLYIDEDFIVGFGSINEDAHIAFDGSLNNGRSWDLNHATQIWSLWSEAYLIRAVVQYSNGRISELYPVFSERTIMPYFQASSPFQNAHYSKARESIPIEGSYRNTGRNSSRELIGFNVYRNGVVINPEIVVESEYLDSNVPPGYYEYYVTAVYDLGESEPSNIEDITIETVLLPPRDLTANARSGAVDLEWREPISSGRNVRLYDNNRLQLLGYNIYRDGLVINDVLLLGTIYEDIELINDVTYEYFVTAVYDEGESEGSNVVTATPSSDLIIQIGDGELVNGTTEAAPINIHNRSLRGQAVYTRSEINAAGFEGEGIITSLSFFVESEPLYSLPDFIIRMKHTTASDAGSHDGGPFETVYSTTNYNPTAGGWDTLVLDTPFVWNGTDNILIDTAFSRSGTASNSGQQRVFLFPSGYRYSRSNGQDQTNATTTEVVNYKPQVRLKMIKAIPSGEQGSEITVGDTTITVSHNSDYPVPYNTNPVMPPDLPTGTIEQVFALSVTGQETIEFIVSTTAHYGYYFQGGLWSDPISRVDGKIVYEIDFDRSEVILFGGDDPDQSLPVELSSFTAFVTADMFVHLEWKAETETNLLGYNVYRNLVNHLNDAAKINSQLLEAENSSVAVEYSYFDKDVVSGQQYYYWLESVDLDLTNYFHGPVSAIVEFHGGSDISPTILLTELIGVYPNPFNPSTTIKFTLKEPAAVSITVFDLLGRKVQQPLLQKHFNPGYHSVLWDGKDSNGRQAASGIYFYRMQTSEGYDMTKRMLLLR